MTSPEAVSNGKLSPEDEVDPWEHIPKPVQDMVREVVVEISTATLGQENALSSLSTGINTADHPFSQYLRAKYPLRKSIKKLTPKDRTTLALRHIEMNFLLAGNAWNPENGFGDKASELSAAIEMYKSITNGPPPS